MAQLSNITEDIALHKKEVDQSGNIAREAQCNRDTEMETLKIIK